MVKRLGKSKKVTLPHEVKTALGLFSNVFNPSYLKVDKINYFSFRAMDNLTGKIIALLFMWTDGESPLKINLSQFYDKNLNISKVADPKIFNLNGDVWGTFNTGHVKKENNKIYIFRLDKNGIKKTFECIFDSRQRIEKNWIFYYDKEDVFCLYSLEPLTILKLSNLNAAKANFELYYKDEKQNFVNYSLGSPGVLNDGSLYFFTHFKLYFKGKRTYFARAFSLNIKNLKINKNKNFYIHNYHSLLGSKKKLNPNLQSCTYISGLTFLEDFALISYGINDNDWNVTKMKIEDLWG